MKKLTTLFFSGLIAASSMAQTIEVLDQYSLNYGGGAEVDMNNDGNLDLLFGGVLANPIYIEDADGNQIEWYNLTTSLMYNPSTQAFEEKDPGFYNVSRPCYKIADFNGDGNMDVAIANSSRDEDHGIPGIYEGNGDGTFSRVDMSFVDADGNASDYEFLPVTLDVADFNNDGLLDIVGIGYITTTDSWISQNAVLINKGNYTFEVTNTDALSDYKLALSTVKIIDYNNDGYMDFFISSNCDNKDVSNSGARALADLFINAGSDGEPGFFYRSYMSDGIYQKANGGLNIADLDGDGYLDIVLHGEGGTGTGEPEDGSWVCISHTYMNDAGSGVFTDKSQPYFSSDLRPLNSTGMATRVFDWDGDGDYDIFSQGWNPEKGTQTGYYWLNDGNASYGESVNIPGASESMLLFPDWDGDGIRDYFITGYTADLDFVATGKRQGVVMINDNTTINERPTAPTSLQISVSGTEYTFSWDEATDAETANASLSYEFYLKKDGVFYNSCTSFVGGDKDGVRKVLALGNVMLSKSITLFDLPDGNYEWGVQAIDASYEGSTFATGNTFKIGTTTDVKEAKKDNKVIVYSDNNILNVKCSAPGDIKIFSVTGKFVDQKLNSDVYSSELTPGIYIVNVTIENENFVKKIVVRN